MNRPKRVPSDSETEAHRNPDSASSPRTDRSRRKRLKGEDRVALIIKGASQLFAVEGFSISTRRLAGQLGVTQALLYRYFPSKAALIDGVFESLASQVKRRRPTEILTNRTATIEDRLTRFYTGYVADMTRTSMRLFVRSSLDRARLPSRYSHVLTEMILKPIVGELRHEANVYGFAERPLMRGERELAMMLHGAVMFMGIRKHVYGMPMSADLGDLVALHVQTFLPGAVLAIRRLHSEPRELTLTVQQLEPRQSRPSKIAGKA